MCAGRISDRATGSRGRSRSSRARLLNMIQARIWESFLTWRRRAISIRDCRIQRMTMLLPRYASLEGGTAAMLTSSGQAANFYAVFNIASCGDHVVASSTIYGGTYNLFAVTMKKMGVEFTFVSPACNGRGTGCGIPDRIPRLYLGKPSPIRHCRS